MHSQHSRSRWPRRAAGAGRRPGAAGDEVVERRAHHHAARPADGSPRTSTATSCTCRRLKGLTIYDVVKPESPTGGRPLPLPHFENEDVDTNGEILLISNDPSEGVGILYVIDVRDPRNPRSMSTLNTGTALATSAWAPTAPHRHGPHRHAASRTASSCTWPARSKGIDIVDLRDPATPMMAGNFRGRGGDRARRSTTSRSTPRGSRGSSASTARRRTT